MTNWRDPILSHFTPEIAAVARLTVVADPNLLLTEPGIVDGVRERGFEIIAFDDHAAFRYAYELRFRRIWDTGKSTNLVVVLRAARVELEGLPYDLIQEARRESRLLSFSLAELFPNLQPHVVAELERNDLDAVYTAQQLHRPGQLGVNATRDFLLRYVFGVDLELIRTPADLLRVLLRRHYSGRVFPESLDEHLIRLLKAGGHWSPWPLEQIVPSRANFLAFLQERWPVFVEHKIAAIGETISEPMDPYELRYAGPTELPFDHDDVRVYIDNLFTEGFLTPTTAIPTARVQGTWMAVGVGGDETDAKVGRVLKLLELLENEFPGSEADHLQWLQTAQRWGETVALRWALEVTLSDTLQAHLEAIQDRIESSFETWVQSHYAALSSLSPWPRPVMLHHIPRFLAHGMGTTSRRKRALIVVDGLSLDQWVAVRKKLPHRAWSIEEGALFAWVPTLTSVSRQSIFAADPPFFFASSIETTQKEEKQWTRFWEDQGLRKAEVVYLCQKDKEPDAALIDRVREQMENPKCRVLAVVVGTVDVMLHGATGMDGLHAGVRNWAQRGSLAKLVGMLVDAEFDLALTADHGNVEARGIGKPNVGATAEQRGERVHVFRDELTRSNMAAQYSGSIAWPTIGLPEDYLPLIAPPRQAFITDGRQTVAHGGVCIEELIVPFVRITRTT